MLKKSSDLEVKWFVSKSSSKLGQKFIFISLLALTLFLNACSSGEDLFESQSINSVETVNSNDSTIVTTGSTIASVQQGAAESTPIAAAPEIGAANKAESELVSEQQQAISSKQADLVLQPSVTELTNNSAKIEWDVKEPATGVIYFGLSEDLNLSTAKESSFNYSAHIQTITGLSPNTKYFFQIESATQAGSLLRSPVENFTTTDSPSVNQGSVTSAQVTPTEPSSSPSLTSPPVIEEISPADWPTNSDGLLPMGGIFYGNFQQGMQTGNAALAIHSARRFRAERSGYITAVTYPNRTLLDINITGRCLPSDPDSVWCKCVNAGLDVYSCGYTLSNSYSVGNGGSYRIQIRENDPATGTPSEVILGESAEPFVPVDNSSDVSPEIALAEKVYLQAGKIYHMVHWNERPPLTCSLRLVPIDEAPNCPRNRGAMGLNGIYLPITVGLDGGIDPFRADTGKNFTRGSDTGEWRADEDNITFYEVKYEDGTWVGESYAGYGGTTEGDGLKAIGDNIVARQALTVRDATRIVDGLWLYFGHQYSKVPDGSPIQVELKDESGAVLATGSIPYSPECSEMSRRGNSSGNRREQHCRQWAYTSLSVETALLEGNTYYVEFVAKASGAYYLPTFFPIDYGGYDSISRNQWHDAQAEVSINGGQDWDLWLGLRWPKRDFGLLFTIKGMPKRLP